MKLFAILILIGIASTPVIAQVSNNDSYDESLSKFRASSRAFQNDEAYDFVSGGRAAWEDPKSQINASNRGIDEADERARRKYELNNRQREANRRTQIKQEKIRQAELQRKKAERERIRAERERQRKAEQLRREQRFQQILAEEQSKANAKKAQYAEQIHYINSQDLSVVDGNEMMGNAMRGGRAVTVGNYNSTVKRRRQRTSTNKINPFNPRKPYKPAQSALNHPEGWSSGFRLDPNAKVRIPLHPEDSIRRIMALEELRNIQKKYDEQLRAGLFTRIDTTFIQQYNRARESLDDNFKMAINVMNNILGELPDMAGFDYKKGEFIFLAKDSTQIFCLAKDGSTFKVYTYDDGIDERLLDNISANSGNVSAYYNNSNNSMGVQVQIDKEDNTKQSGINANILSLENKSAIAKGSGYIIKGGKSAVYSEDEISVSSSMSASAKATTTEAKLEAGVGSYIGTTSSLKEYNLDDNGLCHITERSLDIGLDPQIKVGVAAKWGGGVKEAKEASLKLGFGSIRLSKESDGITFNAKVSTIFTSIGGTYKKTTQDSNELFSRYHLNALNAQNI